jgi:hypothetical protein
VPSADAFADLEADLARFFTFMQNDLVARGIRSLIAESQLDSEFRSKFYCRVHDVRCAAVRHILDHGRALGQFRTDVDEFVVAHMIHGAFWYRFLSGSKRACNAAYARDVVELLRRGLEVPRKRK